MIARILNESSRPDDVVREIIEFAFAQIPGGRLEHGSVVAKVVDGKGGGHASGPGHGHGPKWQGRYAYSIYLTIPADDSKYAIYGLPRVCWHSSRARAAIRELAAGATYDARLGALYDEWGKLYAAGERRYGRWPIYTVLDWREHLVHIAAHELAHIVAWDSRRRGSSEILCELFAERVLNAWRATTTKEEGMSAPTAELDTTLRKQARDAASVAAPPRKKTTARKQRAKARKHTGKRAPVSTLKAAETVLGRAKGPLHIKEITARILAMPDTGLKGKTPEASVGAILAVNSKKRDSAFKRTAPSTYTLKSKR